MALCRASWRCGAAMALQRPGDVQGSELSGMRSTCLLGFKEPLVLFSDSLLASDYLSMPSGLALIQITVVSYPIVPIESQISFRGLGDVSVSTRSGATCNSVLTNRTRYPLGTRVSLFASTIFRIFKYFSGHTWSLICRPPPLRNNSPYS